MAIHNNNINLNISRLVVDLSKYRDTIIKNSLDNPTVCNANYTSNLLKPFKKTKVNPKTIYYDGKELLLEGSTFKYNGNTFNVESKHYELDKIDYTPLANTVIQGDDFRVELSDGIITWSYKDQSGHILDVAPGYQYKLLAGKVRGSLYITACPIAPTVSTEILSWRAMEGEVTIQETHKEFMTYRGLLEDEASYIVLDNTTMLTKGFSKLIVASDMFHTIVSGLSATGHWYSNMYNGNKWIADQQILLLTDENGIYRGGFSAVWNDYLINYFNNTIVSVSRNYSTVVQGFDDVFIEDDEIIVQYDNDYYTLSIVNGLDYIVYKDYVICNTTSYTNTFNFKTGKAFCRSNDYNSRVLFYVTEADLINELKTYYAATGVNVNSLVRNTLVQGTVYPSFPVYGINKPEFKLLDLFNDASRAPVEVYSGTVEDPTNAIFKSTLGSTNVNNINMLYPDSSNTLYGVSVMDKIYDCYGASLIKTPLYNVLAAVNQSGVSTFSYYIGTLNEYSQLFVLQGTVYGINSSGIIMALSIDSSTLSSNAVATISGSMEFIGQTQTEAVFYMRSEKKLYIFTGNLTLSYLCEFAEDPLQVAYRPEDNKIAVRTANSIVVISGNSISEINIKCNSIAYNSEYLLAGNIAISSYNGEEQIDIEYDSGKIGNSYETSVKLDEIDIMLDNSELDEPAYIDYRIDVDDSIGEVAQLYNINGFTRLKSTSNRSEGLSYRIWFKTNCKVLGMSVPGAKQSTSLTDNNG